MLSISGPYTIDDAMINEYRAVSIMKTATPTRILRESLPLAPPYPPQIPHGYPQLGMAPNIKFHRYVSSIS
jgi:hypothetical protein